MSSIPLHVVGSSQRHMSESLGTTKRREMYWAAHTESFEAIWKLTAYIKKGNNVGLWIITDLTCSSYFFILIALFENVIKSYYFILMTILFHTRQVESRQLKCERTLLLRRHNLKHCCRFLLAANCDQSKLENSKFTVTISSKCFIPIYTLQQSQGFVCLHWL